MKLNYCTKLIVLFLCLPFTASVFAAATSATPTAVPPMTQFNAPTFSQAPTPNPAAVTASKPAPKSKQTRNPPNDMAVPTAPVSAVNTPSLNAAMPVSKPSQSPAKTGNTFPAPNHGVHNTETTPSTDATTDSTPVPASPVPSTEPTPTDTQESPSLLKPNAAPVDKAAEPAASSSPPVHQ